MLVPPLWWGSDLTASDVRGQAAPERRASHEHRASTARAVHERRASGLRAAGELRASNTRLARRPSRQSGNRPSRQCVRWPSRQDLPRRFVVGHSMAQRLDAREGERRCNAYRVATRVQADPGVPTRWQYVAPVRPNQMEKRRSQHCEPVPQVFHLRSRWLEYGRWTATTTIEACVRSCSCAIFVQQPCFGAQRCRANLRRNVGGEPHVDVRRQVEATPRPSRASYLSCAPMMHEQPPSGERAACEQRSTGEHAASERRASFALTAHEQQTKNARDARELCARGARAAPSAAHVRHAG